MSGQQAMAGNYACQKVLSLNIIEFIVLMTFNTYLMYD